MKFIFFLWEFERYVLPIVSISLVVCEVFKVVIFLRSGSVDCIRLPDWTPSKKFLGSNDFLSLSISKIT